MPSTNSRLLELPRELRDQIWKLAYQDHNVTPSRTELFAQGSAPRLLFAKDCEPCNDELRPLHESHISEHETTFRNLLVCKQIYNETSGPYFYATLTLHISNPAILSRIRTRSPAALRAKIRSLTLYVHLSDETRYEWLSQLSHLPGTFPNLAHLTIQNHMRPPTSYDRLIDAIYLVGPLSTFSRPPSSACPSPTNTTLSSNPSTSTLPTTSCPFDISTGTSTSKNHINITTSLKFAYTNSEIMFESPFLGEIRTSDAIDEHEAVIREVLVDDAFRDAAIKGDLNVMTVRLLAMARSHEQAWLEGLQRRRMAEMGMGPDGDEDDEDDEDEEAEEYEEEGGSSDVDSHPDVDDELD